MAARGEGGGAPGAGEEPLDSAYDWVAEHTRRYVESGGSDGYYWEGLAPTLVLTTRGRRSGRRRRNALIYQERDGDYVVVASKGGAPSHPLWYTNLVADPNVVVQVGAEVFKATARTATPAERAELWPVMTSVWPPYDEYQAKTSREIPVVVLTRT